MGVSKIQQQHKHVNDTSLACLTDTIYFEARGETKAGMLAVANVVVNRTKQKSFPSTVCEVVQQKGQFSWVGMGYKVVDFISYNRAKLIAYRVLRGVESDPTLGATHFHTTDLAVDWSTDKIRKTVIIGSHQFYKQISAS